LGEMELFGWDLTNPWVLGGGVAVLVALNFVYQALFGKKERNLFAPDRHWQSGPEPNEDIIKVGYKKNIKKEYDVVVVGSGLGSLSTACLLAKSGLEVCVLEQHDRAGGCSHVFKEHGWEWDVGLHYVGRIGNPSQNNRIISDMMTDGKLEWNPVQEVYDTAVICDKQYPMRHGFDKAKQGIIDKFPNEKEAIEKFFSMVVQCLQESKDCFDHLVPPMLPWYMNIGFRLMRFFSPGKANYWQGRTTQSVLDECTSNKELQYVLTYCWADLGTPPARSSFWIMSGLLYHFWSNGGFYPVGGPVKLAQHAVPIIQRNGGGVFVRAPVERIMIENGKAVGVKIDKGPEVRARKAVVSGCGANVTWNKLLEKSVSSKFEHGQWCKEVGHSFQGTSLFVGLNKTSEELNLPSGNFWVMNGKDIDDVDFEAQGNPVENGPKLFFLGFPSAKDPDYNKRNPGKAVASIISHGNWEHFSQWEDGKVKHRGEEYEAVKERIAGELMEGMFKLVPQTNGEVGYYEMGTPLSNKFYLGYEHGEIYGLDHSTRRFIEAKKYLKSKTPIPGLYLTGQDIVSAGIASALVSGVLTAGAILGRNLYGEMEAEGARRKKAFKSKSS